MEHHKLKVPLEPSCSGEGDRCSSVLELETAPQQVEKSSQRAAQVRRRGQCDNYDAEREKQPGPASKVSEG